MTATIQRRDRQFRGPTMNNYTLLQQLPAYPWVAGASAAGAPVSPTVATIPVWSSSKGAHLDTKPSPATLLQPIITTTSTTAQTRLSKPVADIRLHTKDLPHVDDASYSAPSSASTESSISTSPQVLLTPIHEHQAEFPRVTSGPSIHLPSSSFPPSSERQVSQVSPTEPCQPLQPQQQPQALHPQGMFASGVRGLDDMSTDHCSGSCDWSLETAAESQDYNTGNQTASWYPENHTALMAKGYPSMNKLDPNHASFLQSSSQPSHKYQSQIQQHPDHTPERPQLYPLQIPDQHHVQPIPHSSSFSTASTVAVAPTTTAPVAHSRAFLPASTSMSATQHNPPFNTVHPLALTTIPPSISPLREFRSQSRVTLHHPRPSRRIPIISLSKLASAASSIDSTSSAPVRATGSEITPSSSSITSIMAKSSSLSSSSLSSSHSARSYHNSSLHYHHHNHHHPYHHPYYPHQHHIHDPGKYRVDDMRSRRGPSSVRTPRSSTPSQSPQDRVTYEPSFVHKHSQKDGIIQCSCGCMATFNMVRV